MNHKIVKRKYVAVTVELISPLTVSSGEKLYSDADVLRNGDGDVFVPGTSLAGAFRSILEDHGCSESVMGYSKDDKEESKGGKGVSRDDEENSESRKERMSSLYISDLYFEKQEEISVSIRDRVKLDEEKTVDNKFDTEIVEPGIAGTLFLNYVQREGDQADYDGAVNMILRAIQSGAIRIGANKNRGFGRFRILEIYEREFKKEDVGKWISFVPHSTECSAYGKGVSYEVWTTEAEKEKTGSDYKSGYLKIHVPFHLTGGISIRKYSTKPDMPDFEHITCGINKEGEPIPVVPGTSWGGAIRSDALSILTKLVGKKKAMCIIKGWFGHVKEKEERKPGEPDAWQSTVVINESCLEGGTWKTMTRNQISRFDASTKTGALYSEQTYFGGNTVLELMVRKDERVGYKALVGLLLLIIYDLQNGYISVGGQTAIGRGIFEKRGETKIDSGEPIKEEEYNKALYDFLYEGGAENVLERLRGIK